MFRLCPAMPAPMLSSGRRPRYLARVPGHVEQLERTTKSAGGKEVRGCREAASGLPQGREGRVGSGEGACTDGIGVEDVMGMKGQGIGQYPLKVPIVRDHKDVGVGAHSNDERNA